MAIHGVEAALGVVQLRHQPAHGQALGRLKEATSAGLIELMLLPMKVLSPQLTTCLLARTLPGSPSRAAHHFFAA